MSINYPAFMRGEIDRAILDFSTDATDTINIAGIVALCAAFCPAYSRIDRAELANFPPTN